MTENNITGKVFDIYRGTTHDGPGMRTTLFMKGCPLSCKWCHNPEGMSFSNGVTYMKEKCLGCRMCSMIAGKDVVVIKEGRPEFVADYKSVPETCAQNCPAGALKMEAKTYTVNELFREAIKDRDFFDSFGGGVTISGGEPTAQSEFVCEVFKKLKKENIHTALDTSGYVKWEILEKLLPYVDLVLFDLKIADNRKHQELTGVENKLILENLHRLTEYRNQHCAKPSIWIRTPLIPGDTAIEENILAIGKILKEVGTENIERWELCAFNNTCSKKYQKDGKPWPYQGVPLMTDEEAAAMVTAAAQNFDKEKIVRSGFTRKPDKEVKSDD